MGKYEAARKILNNAVKTSTESHKGWSYLCSGLLHKKQGNNIESRADMQLALLYLFKIPDKQKLFKGLRNIKLQTDELDYNYFERFEEMFLNHSKWNM